ncbi:hypothetical protein A2853_02810 [Candidatus Kaiserbacteria bacterium RIFCSPHIGHO2_01_FULL_55_17]|uniref:LTD domain-containing protein n=1 Tax=Candidatus Kaiserbacteria bacterium RIFCSPHIGHO2_01_FULL_55_17 TaxID=1798484 RepID=A0A1F6DBF6_9BACT|nr:MAG: hypothetical protein A2853_02810 [Candidatus Kaiserbacteria bacterium RIFCSPHIGHO2_01_FULL_55_17]
MIKKILIGFAIATVVILFLLWLATGGFREVAGIARGITSPLTADFWSGLSLSQLRLPWQPEPVRGPDISGGNPAGEGGETQTTEEELASAQKEYDDMMKKLQDAQTFGEPSPFRGQVTLAQGGAVESSPSAEHVILEAAWNNSAPVSISGWSVQSALTGIRSYFPRGADPFVMGAVNTQTDIYLAPGGSASVTSGPSPVGTSLRENLCTGYLSTLQTFVPSLSRNCPAPSDSLPLTAENLRTYGDACLDFVETLPPCTFPSETPPNISSACRIFLMNNISYNGCVQNYRHTSGFTRDSWRIYLNAYGELWRNSHDIIRLLDSEGRTVDVVSY